MIFFFFLTFHQQIFISNKAATTALSERRHEVEKSKRFERWAEFVYLPVCLLYLQRLKSFAATFLN